MALTKTPICDFGKKADYFELKSIDNKIISLNDVKGENGTLIMFICNHCPYVIHYHDEIKRLAVDFEHTINMVAISSNDIKEYPQDGPDKMRELWAELGLSFPYLFDSTQDIAKNYKAVCTPEFYLFDSSQKLVYRGRLDKSSPNSGLEPTGEDLRDAINSVLNNKEVNPDQFPSMGCNIKWR